MNKVPVLVTDGPHGSGPRAAAQLWRQIDSAMWPIKPKAKPQTVPPQPTPEMHEEARRNPNSWVYVIHGSFGPNDAVPPDRIVGAWKVDGAGRITGEYNANPNYRPPEI